MDKSILLEREPILFFADVPLYESELDDNGSSQLSIKVVPLPPFNPTFCLLSSFIRDKEVSIMVEIILPSSRAISCVIFRASTTEDISVIPPPPSTSPHPLEIIPFCLHLTSLHLPQSVPHSPSPVVNSRHLQN